MQETRVVVTYKRRTGKDGTVPTAVSASTFMQSPPSKFRKAVALVPMLASETTVTGTTATPDTGVTTSPTLKAPLTLHSRRLANMDVDTKTAPPLVPSKRKSDPRKSINDSDISKQKLSETESLKPNVPLQLSTFANKTRRITRMKIGATGATATTKSKDHEKSRESQLDSPSDASKVFIPATSASASTTTATQIVISRTISPSHLSVSSFERLAVEVEAKNFNINTTTSVSKISTVTYAKSRSYLQVLETEEDGNRAFIKIDEGLDSSDDDEEKKKELRNVHELRESGKAARFTDEVEYITSGLSPDNSLGMRRSSNKPINNHRMNISYSKLERITCYVVFVNVSMTLIRNVDILMAHEKIIPFVVKNFQLLPDILVTPPRNKYERNFISNFNLGILCMDALFTSSTATKSVHSEILQSRQLSSLIFSKFVQFCKARVPLVLCCKDSTSTPTAETLPPPFSKQIRQIRANLKLFNVVISSASKERRLEFFNNSELLKTILGILAFYYTSLSTLSKPKVSGIVELVFLVLQLLVDISAEDENACIALNNLGAHQLICRIVLHAWQFSANTTQTKNKEKRQQPIENGIFLLSAPSEIIPFLQEYNGLLLSSLACVTNLVRNDKSMKLNFGQLKMNPRCPCWDLELCECQKVGVMKNILTLFVASAKTESSNIPKTAVLIMCALIGCLVDDCPVNAGLVRVVTDPVLSFAEMADLLQLFAEFHRNSQAEKEEKATDDGENLNNGSVSEAVDGIASDTASTADAAGILKQIDRLLYIAKVLRS
ncbi:hypothetical protein HK100_001140 [Physocladia obscura]|uniref:Wings apart-like protein C-terminal domain-containing protein n=1 Tax=Physocladia obscura TaxID=109957 RepID=A0AAD5SZ00_9FUNG|nr:hypothetical protein HK100_001140 [Physocladia obscura]